MKENSLKHRLLLILGFLRHFLVEKLVSKNRPKSKANPLEKWQFLVNFFLQKNVCKWLKMKENSLKHRLLLIYGF